MDTLLNKINEILSGPIMVWGVIIIGIILTVRTGFVQFKRHFYMLSYIGKQLLSKNKKKTVNITPFQALSTALAGTIGTGNIAGVASAIAIGGPGALFWMWISAFLGMATKYSEIVLAMKYRQTNKDGSNYGGPMYYIQHAMGGRKLAISFAVICILGSFAMGNMVQSNTGKIAIESIIGTNNIGIVTAIVLIMTLGLGILILGGIKSIVKFTEKFIPAMALFYIISCLTIIFMNISEIPVVIEKILVSAFSLKSVGGGILGYGMVRAIKVGVARGVFTNESGLGSAPIAHAAAENDLPAKQGLWGMFEVYFDTIIMCSLTGFVVILGGLYGDTNLTGTQLTLFTFERYLGNISSTIIAVSTIFFATSTIISWSYYGEECVRYLSKKRIYVIFYKLIYIFLIYYGAMTTIDLVWGLADLFNSLMMVPNLLGVVILSGVVKKETKILDDLILNNK